MMLPHPWTNTGGCSSIVACTLRHPAAHQSHVRPWYLVCLVDVILPEQYFRYFLVPIRRSRQKRCSTFGIRLVTVDIAPSEQGFHNSLEPSTSSSTERSLAVDILCVGVDVVPFK